MKVIIAGGRDFVNMDVLKAAIECSGFEITEVVCGMAKGADTLGLQYAQEFAIPIKKFPADWNKHGKPAGIIRNNEMAHYADALIALPGGVGTANMINQAKALGLRVYVTPANAPNTKT